MINNNNNNDNKNYSDCNKKIPSIDFGSSAHSPMEKQWVIK